MKTSLVQIAALVIGLVLAAAAQDVLPAFVGVKLPLLAGVALFAAWRLTLPAALAAAVSAGLFCDALAGRAPCCATALFPLLAVAASHARAGAREVPLPVVGAVGLGAAACSTEIWLTLGGDADSFSLLVRLCAALPLGLMAGAALFALLAKTMDAIGFDAGEEA